jgi:hypothetical protein
MAVLGNDGLARGACSMTWAAVTFASKLGGIRCSRDLAHLSSVANRHAPDSVSNLHVRFAHPDSKALTVASIYSVSSLR